jgi:hypothetical protein
VALEPIESSYDKYAFGTLRAAKSFFWMYSTSSIAVVFVPPARVSMRDPESPPRVGRK